MAQMVERSAAVGLTTHELESIPSRGMIYFFVNPKCPGQLWCPQSLIFRGSRGEGEVVPRGGGVKRQRHEFNHFPPTTAEVKNAWSYRSPPPHTFNSKGLSEHSGNYTGVTKSIMWGDTKRLNIQQRQRGEFYLCQCVQKGVAACSMLIRSCLLNGSVKLTIHICGYFASRFVRQA